MKTRPCKMWPFKRTPRKAQSCGKAATLGWRKTRDGSNDLVPICNDCVADLNYDENLLEPLK